MAQDLSVLQPKILARALTVLREKAIMPRYVNRDYSTDAAQKGSAITISMSNPQVVSNVAPGATSPQPADNAPQAITLVLGTWIKTAFYLTEKENAEIDANNLYIPNQLAEAARALANRVNADLFGLHVSVSGCVGTPGATPFSSDPSIAVAARKALNLQLAPSENRAFIIDPNAEANALNLQAFQYVQYGGNTDVQKLGRIGQRFAFDFDSTTTVPTHTSGSCAAKTVTLISNSLLGATQITLKVSATTGTLNQGDVIQIAGDTQNYVVTDIGPLTIDTTGVVVHIQGYRAVDGLAKAVDGSGTPVAVTVLASHVVNLAFYPEAFAIAMRPAIVTPNSMPAGTQTMIMTDPVSGIPLRMDIMPQYHQTAYELSLLYGVKCVRPEYAVRVLG